MGDKILKIFEIFKEKAKILHKKEYDYTDSVYKSSREFLDIKCNTCNSVFPQRPSAHLQGQGCPFCAKNKIGIANTLDVEKFKDRCSHLTDEGKIQYGTFKASTAQVGILCDIHGQSKVKALSLFKDMKRNSACMSCHKDKARVERQNILLSKIKDKYPELEVVSKDTYKDNKSKITMLCDVHGTFRRTYNKILGLVDNKYPCPSCNKENVGRWSQKVMGSNKEFFKKQTCYIYIMSVTGKNEEFNKIGFSVNIGDRIYALKRDSNTEYTFKKIYTFKSDTYTCCGIEKYLKEKFKENKYVPKIYFGGYTEAYQDIPVTKGTIDSYIEEYLSLVEEDQ